MMRDTAELAKVMRANGFDLFSDRSSYAESQAQQNLQGRTYYLSKGTMSYFKAKVNHCRILDNGLLLGIVESVAHPDRGRIHRPVFFDIFGAVVSRAKIEEAYKTSAAAEKAFWREADALDAYALTLEAVARVKDRAIRQIADCDRVLPSAV